MPWESCPGFHSWYWFPCSPTMTGAGSSLRPWLQRGGGGGERGRREKARGRGGHVMLLNNSHYEVNQPWGCVLVAEDRKEDSKSSITHFLTSPQSPQTLTLSWNISVWYDCKQLKIPPVLSPLQAGPTPSPIMYNTFTNNKNLFRKATG